MIPLQFAEMRIDKLEKPQRLTLYGRRDIVRTGVVCWPIWCYYFEGSPFKPCDYYFQTIGLDGVE